MAKKEETGYWVPPKGEPGWVPSPAQAAVKKKKVFDPGYAGGIMDAFLGTGAYAGDLYAPGNKQSVASLLGSITGGLPSQVKPTSTDSIIQSMLQNSPTAASASILPSLSTSTGDSTNLQSYLNSLGSLSSLAGGASTGGTAGTRTASTTGGLSLADLLGGTVGGNRGIAPEYQPTIKDILASLLGGAKDTATQLPIIGGDAGLAPDGTPAQPDYGAPSAGGDGGGAWAGPGTGTSLADGFWGAVRSGWQGPAGAGAVGTGLGGGRGVAGVSTNPQANLQNTEDTTAATTDPNDPYAAWRQFLPPASNYVPKEGGLFYKPEDYIGFDIATDPNYQARFAAPETRNIDPNDPQAVANARQELSKSGQYTQEQLDKMDPATIATIISGGFSILGGIMDPATIATIISGASSLLGGILGSQGAGDAADAELAYLREAREQNLAGGLYAGDLGAQAASLAANELIGSQGQAGQTMSTAYLTTGDIQADAAQRAADTLSNAILSGGQYKTTAAGNLYNAAVGTGQTGVNIQEQKLQQALQGLAPYTGAGQTAVGQQLAETLAGPGDYKESDEYKFQLDQALKASTAQLSQQGLGQSGRHVVEAAKIAQGLSSAAEQQQFNNWLARQGALGNLSTMGLSGATTGGQLSVGTGASQADTLLAAQQLAQRAGLYGAEAGGTALTQAGTAQSSGIRDIANAISTGIMGSSGSLADMYINQGQSAAGGYTGAADARTQALLTSLGLNVPLAQQQGLAAGDQYINQANTWTNSLSNLSDLIWLLQGNTGGNSGLASGF